MLPAGIEPALSDHVATREHCYPFNPQYQYNPLNCIFSAEHRQIIGRKSADYRRTFFARSVSRGQTIAKTHKACFW